MNFFLFFFFFYMDRMWTLTVAASEPSSLDSRSVYAPASPSFTAVITRVERSALFSTWQRSSPLGSVWPERIHWTKGAGSPENSPATVRGFPGSALTLSGRASIFGGMPVDENKSEVSQGSPSWNDYNTWLHDSHINKQHFKACCFEIFAHIWIWLHQSLKPCFHSTVLQDQMSRWSFGTGTFILHSRGFSTIVNYFQLEKSCISVIGIELHGGTLLSWTNITSSTEMSLIQPNLCPSCPVLWRSFLVVFAHLLMDLYDGHVIKWWPHLGILGLSQTGLLNLFIITYKGAHPIQGTHAWV